MAGPRERVWGRVGSQTTFEPASLNWAGSFEEAAEVEAPVESADAEDAGSGTLPRELLSTAGSMSEREKRRVRACHRFCPGMTVLDAAGGGKPDPAD